jgi:hypothetical protein
MAVDLTNQSINVAGLGIDIIRNLPPEFIRGVQAISLAALAYVLFLIIRTVINFRSGRRIKKMASDIEEIKKKMDILLSNKKNKEK